VRHFSYDLQFGPTAAEDASATGARADLSASWKRSRRFCRSTPRWAVLAVLLSVAVATLVHSPSQSRQPDLRGACR